MRPSIAILVQMTPQARRVLLHLERHGEIDRTTAGSRYGITRLPARIHELRQAGLSVAAGPYGYRLAA